MTLLGLVCLPLVLAFRTTRTVAAEMVAAAD